MVFIQGFITLCLPYLIIGNLCSSLFVYIRLSCSYCLLLLLLIDNLNVSRHQIVHNKIVQIRERKDV